MSAIKNKARSSNPPVSFIFFKSNKILARRSFNNACFQVLKYEKYRGSSNNQTLSQKGLLVSARIKFTTCFHLELVQIYLHQEFENFHPIYVYKILYFSKWFPYNSTPSHPSFLVSHPRCFGLLILVMRKYSIDPIHLAQ